MLRLEVTSRDAISRNRRSCETFPNVRAGSCVTSEPNWWSPRSRMSLPYQFLSLV
jgi:hypothetical protein